MPGKDKVDKSILEHKQRYSSTHETPKDFLESLYEWTCDYVKERAPMEISDKVNLTRGSCLQNKKADGGSGRYFSNIYREVPEI